MKRTLLITLFIALSVLAARSAFAQSATGDPIGFLDSLTCSGANGWSYDPDYVPPVVLGCTNPSATNYNPSATQDDGSCVVPPAVCISRYRWVNAQPPGPISAEQGCGAVGAVPVSSSSYGVCASGEDRPVAGYNVGGIDYTRGTWGGGGGKGGDFVMWQNGGYRCYNNGQKQDKDNTDVAVAFYCDFGSQYSDFCPADVPAPATGGGGGPSGPGTTRNAKLNLAPHSFFDAIASLFKPFTALAASGDSNTVEIYDGSNLIATVSANQPRPDVNAVMGVTGNHGFSWAVPASLLDGASHTLSFYGTNTDSVGKTTQLTNSPSTITCPPPKKPNSAPSTPSLSCPANGSKTNTPLNVSFTSSDPDNNNVRYNIDWDANGSVDQVVPAGGAYASSGSQQSASRSWSTPGTKTVNVSATDDQGATSAAASCSFSLSATYYLGVSVSGSGTVSSNPSGISCGSQCNAPFDSGTSVSLTASPSSGYRFAGWGGACSGTGGCSFGMNGDTSVSASFVATTCTDSSANNFGGALPCTYTDACPNIAGNQASVPAGMVINSSGNCVTAPATCADTSANNYGGSLPCTYTDLCPNIAGNQASVPSGMVINSSGNCVTAPATCTDSSANNFGGSLPCTYTDACPNIAGNQASVPAGMVINSSGNCVTAAAKCTDSTATNFGGALPCTYAPVTCTDPAATNIGGALPCTFLSGCSSNCGTGGSGFCAINPSDPSCGPGSSFCSSNPSAPSCTAGGFTVTAMEGNIAPIQFLGDIMSTSTSPATSSPRRIEVNPVSGFSSPVTLRVIGIQSKAAGKALPAGVAVRYTFDGGGSSATLNWNSALGRYTTSSGIGSVLEVSFDRPINEAYDVTIEGTSANNSSVKSDFTLTVDPKATNPSFREI